MLTGIRVLEFEGLGPGPFAAMMMAELGAEVTVIHRTGGSPFPQQGEAPSLLDRGKRSIVLDLKSDADRDIALRLMARSDAVIEGFRPGVMERLGLGPDVAHGLNPALVYGRITGWGQTGPRASEAGHDLNYIALSGALHFAGDPGEPPAPPPTMLGDVAGGAHYLVIGLLAALLTARTSGKGAVVDAAIVDGAAHMTGLLQALRWQADGSGRRTLLDGPHWSRCYRCRDGGFLSVQCLEPKFYAVFLDRLGLADDPQFARQMDAASWPDLTDRLAGLFGTRDRDDWAALFAGTDACVAPVLSPDEAAQNPHGQARAIWTDDAGTRVAAAALRFGGPPRVLPPAAPRDADREKILADLGDQRAAGSGD